MSDTPFRNTDQLARLTEIISDSTPAAEGRISTPPEQSTLLMRVQITPALRERAEAADMKLYDFLDAYISRVSLPDPNAAPMTSRAALPQDSHQPVARKMSPPLHKPFPAGIWFKRIFLLLAALGFAGWLLHSNGQAGRIINKATNSVYTPEAPSPTLKNLDVTTSVSTTHLRGKVYNGNLQSIEKVVCFHVTVRDPSGAVVADRHIHDQVFWPACHVSDFEVETGLPLAAPNKVSLTVEPAER